MITKKVQDESGKIFKAKQWIAPKTDRIEPAGTDDDSVRAKCIP
jgi:hypothetical protein